MTWIIISCQSVSVDYLQVHVGRHGILGCSCASDVPEYTGTLECTSHGSSRSISMLGLPNRLRLVAVTMAMVFLATVIDRVSSFVLVIEYSSDSTKWNSSREREKCITCPWLTGRSQFIGRSQSLCSPVHSEGWQQEGEGVL